MDDTRQPQPSMSKGEDQERERTMTTTTASRLERLLAMEDALHGNLFSNTLSDNNHDGTSSRHHGNTTSLLLPPHSVWREKVTQWCYNVVDHLDECRSVVYVAMDILDRFSALVNSNSNSNNNNGTTNMNERCFELASMSALFLAIRITGSGNLQLSQLVSMTSSSSGIQSKHIVAMGTRIIQRLGNDFWRVRCVTPLDFLQTTLLASSSSSPSLSTADQQEVLNAASFLCEIAVCDAALAITERPSHIALAALLNALDAHYQNNDDENNNVLMVKTIMERCTKSIPHDSQSLMRLRLRLQAVYGQTLDNSSQPNGAAVAAATASPHLVPQDSSPCQHTVNHSVSNDTLCNSNNKRPLEDVLQEEEEDHVVFLMAPSPSRRPKKRSMQEEQDDNDESLPYLIHPDE